MSGIIYQPFLDWVRLAPMKPAISDLAQTWTYEDLYEKATRIASSLESSSGINRSVIIGNKSNMSVAAIMGTLFSGQAYCTLDINLPSARFDKIFKILSPFNLILTGLTPPLKYELENTQIKPSCILDLEGDLPSEIFDGVGRLSFASSGIIKKSNPEDAAYIIFTSGSTGMPKGVSVSHKSADSALDMFQRHISIQENDRICNQVALCFDLSVFDIFGSLRQGAELYIIPTSISGVPNRFLKHVKEKKLTSLFTVPSTVKYIIENSIEDLKDSGLRNLLFSGEPLSSPLVKSIREFFPDTINLWNLYGATEIPYALAQKVEQEDSANSFSMKGKDVEVLIHGNTSNSSIGELMIRSPAMLSGYMVKNQAQLYPPFKEGGWYPTGDLASLAPDGKISLHGRKDRQIKILGHRIELDEIEHELECFSEIKEAAVVFDEKSNALIGFVVLDNKSSKHINQSNLEELCQAKLPLIMCPKSFYFLSELPHTASGKKNRKLLIEQIDNA